ncbi:MAG: cysteine desulfurase family protein [SAR324 cluster bacterium]|nr:cysteine desulfurase family protein [SAR324 cluster bacterium]
MPRQHLDCPREARYGGVMDLEFYLDNAATTPMLPEVLAEARPLLDEQFGNPSSLHPLGMNARRAVKHARERLARELGLPPQGVIFTSGGTESDNLALRGVFASQGLKGERLLYSAIEHPAVRESAQALEREGVRTAEIPVTGEGAVDLPRLEAMLDGDVRMVSCMAVNNEIGTRQPLVEIGRLIKRKAPRAVFHVDAVQAFCKQTLPWREAQADLLTLSAHKVHGAKGAGALVRCRPIPLEPWSRGGGQEDGLRSGTENPFAIAAFAHAAQQAGALHREQRAMRSEYHRRWLELLAEYPRIRVFRSSEQTHFVISFNLPSIPGEVALHHLEAEGLYVSTGSACSTRKPEPSRTLLAIGLSESEALSTIRISFSVFNTQAGLEQVFAAFRRAMAKLEKI